MVYIFGNYGVVTGLLLAILCEAGVASDGVFKAAECISIVLIQNNLEVSKKEWKIKGLVGI